MPSVDFLNSKLGRTLMFLFGDDPIGSVAKIDALAKMKDSDKALNELLGGLDPDTGITWNSGRQVSGVERDIGPAQSNAPWVNPKALEGAPRINPDRAHDFKMSQKATLARAFPDEMRAMAADQYMPKPDEFGAPVAGVDEEGRPVYRRFGKRAWEGAPIKGFAPPKKDDMTPYQERQLELSERRLNRLEGPQPMKPPKDMRLKAGTAPEDEDFEAIPGSKLALETAEKERKAKGAKAADAAAVRTTEQAADATIAAIDDLLKDQALPAVIGTMDARTPTLLKSSAAAERKIDNIRSRIIIDVLGGLKASSANGSSGFGALSNQEASILGNAVAALEQATSDQEFRRQLGLLKNYLSNTKNSLKLKYRDEYGEDFSGDGGGQAQSGGATVIDWNDLPTRK